MVRDLKIENVGRRKFALGFPKLGGQNNYREKVPLKSNCATKKCAEDYCALYGDQEHKWSHQNRSRFGTFKV